jgi:DNA-directed RNA polymerase subunit RPC12/RpoP
MINKNQSNFGYHVFKFVKDIPTGRFIDGRELYNRLYKCFDCSKELELTPEQCAKIDITDCGIETTNITKAW